MRERAYRPEVVRCLEDRSLLTGLGALSPHPVVLRRLRLAMVGEHIDESFTLFSLHRESLPHLRHSLRDVAVIIPFGRVDGLGDSINRILDRMVDDVAARVPHAVDLAKEEVLGVTRESVKARVVAGDVVMR